MRLFFFLLILCYFSGYSQESLFEGTVRDSLAPLENANLLARPAQKGGRILFATTDKQGRYKFNLLRDVEYVISVSYLGYTPQNITITATSERSEHHFVLKSTGIELTEVVISAERLPITVKKDTTVYKVDAFVLGNERKMKEVLEKLPGVEVDDDGIIKVQGKQVTQMLVEGRSFFGGSSKLAVENIPADALDKIEVIDNFNEVSFLKNVSSSNELAMNVLLKEDKKKFVFGDLEAGAGNDSHHLAHTALFYYHPELNLNLIGDVNDFGKSAFSFQDLMRFQGGRSRFTKQRGLSVNLSTYSQNNQNMYRHNARFLAFNYGYMPTSKLYLSGFSIFSKLLTNYKKDTSIEYLTNQKPLLEWQQLTNEQQNLLGMGNIKLDYAPSSDEKWFYNAQFDANNNHISNDLISESPLRIQKIHSLTDADNISFKQYVEWHKVYNPKETTTFVINHSYDKITIDNQWFVNKLASLPSLLPLLTDTEYHLLQTQQTKKYQIDAIFKHYWTINDLNHLYTNIGSNLEMSSLDVREGQLLTNGNFNDFASEGFGNMHNYTLADAFLGLEYRFKIRKLVSKFSAFLRYYRLKNNQSVNKRTSDLLAFEPAFETTYEFSNSEEIKFHYAKRNIFPKEEMLLEKFSLLSYNAITKGNPMLDNELFHSFSLNYRRNSFFKRITLSAHLSFNRKTKTIGSEYIFEDINRFSTWFLTHKPETSWNFMTTFERKILGMRWGLMYSGLWSDYTQKMNRIITENHRMNHSVKAYTRVTYKKANLDVSYTKSWNEHRGISLSKLTSDYWLATADYRFTNDFSTKLQYAYFKNEQLNLNQSADFQYLNISLDYQRSKSPWGFHLAGNNVLGTKAKINSSISNYYVVMQTTHVMPRTLVFSIRYKL
ncbi:carboxypeptidase-like regulatory domain-containing protein [Capnocytophaga canis]|uniref:carboxypeptidase-like regulatory domain-containing protein n=1 Tax=Capnocytophaga canis TaxID=1848903 RepID=UPI00385F2C78